jgi:hypothetical protein
LRKWIFTFRATATCPRELPGGSEGHIAQGEHHPSVGDAVKVGHLLGDRQRHPAVARRHNRYLGTQKAGKGIISDMVLNGGPAFFFLHGSFSSDGSKRSIYCIRQSRKNAVAACYT